MSLSMRAAVIHINSRRISGNISVDRLSLGLHAFDTGYVSLKYQVFGTAGPLVIVQVPGWGIGQSYLSNGLSFLHASFKVLYLVPRGTSPSSRPTRALDMSSAHMVEDLEALRQYLGLVQMTLIGHSNGGSIILAYAQKWPECVMKMVLLDHELQGFDDSATFTEFALRRQNDPIYSTALIRLQTFNAENDERMAESLKAILPFYFADPQASLPQMIMTMEDAPSSWALNAQKAADTQYPTYLEDNLEHVKAETLIVVGREDPFCSVRAAERAHISIEGSRLYILERCGHFAWIEQRERLSEIMCDFLLD